LTFLNSNPDSEENKQFVFDFDSDRPDRDSEPEKHSCPNSNTRRTRRKTRQETDSEPVAHIRIALEPIAKSSAMAPDRYWLSHTRGGDRWVLPIQLEFLEGWVLYHQIASERDRAVILAAAESLVNGGVK